MCAKNSTNDDKYFASSLLGGISAIGRIKEFCYDKVDWIVEGHKAFHCKFIKKNLWKTDHLKHVCRSTYVDTIAQGTI